jgi:signal transduction histidine kinase
MPVELAEIAAGLPFAASIAMATGISALREGRRRTSLNEAMHELRRPLQALALSLPHDSRGGEAAGSALRMAVAAIERLEREVNGEASAAVAERVLIRPLVEAALVRWRPRAAVAGRSLELTWNASCPALLGDRVALAQAVDNLISNGFEHGRGAVEVDVGEEGGLLRLAVRDGGGREGPVRPGRRADRGRAARMHGHGLKIVRRVAAGQGGTFRLSRSSAGTEARLDLPLARGPQ